MLPKILLVTAIFFSFQTTNFAQTNSPAQNTLAEQGWQPIGFNVAGHNIMNGVEAFYQVSNCNGENVVFVKFINHNDYAVTLEWFDAVFTQELKWFSKENTTAKKNISLDAKQEKTGDCTSENVVALKIKLKDFISDVTNFKRYGAKEFSVSQK